MAESVIPSGLPGGQRVVHVIAHPRTFRNPEACRVSTYAGAESCDRTKVGVCTDPVFFLVEPPQSSLKMNALVCKRHLQAALAELGT